MEFLKDTLAVGFFIALMLFFSHMWAVQSDKQAQAEHNMIERHKLENKGILK